MFRNIKINMCNVSTQRITTTPMLSIEEPKIDLFVSYECKNKFVKVCVYIYTAYILYQYSIYVKFIHLVNYKLHPIIHILIHPI